MTDQIRFQLRRISEKLWIRPLLACGVSLLGVLVAGAAEGWDVPQVSPETVSILLRILTGNMLAVATFSVASMVSAYASAGTTATPRSFPLVLADDVSQNALSVFIAAFIYGVVAQIALENSYYGRGGRFVLFALTIGFLVAVIGMFVYWVDRVARLGRLGSVVEKVAHATEQALDRRARHPHLGGVAPKAEGERGHAVSVDEIGYVQRVGVGALQNAAEALGVRVLVEAVPGAFVGRSAAVARVYGDDGGSAETQKRVRSAFTIGKRRTYDEDPRFGLRVLSEIASRALSPAVNDPGTAIDVLRTTERLFSGWTNTETEPEEARCPRVAVPKLDVAGALRDAFRPIGRDGAGNVEVAEELQGSLCRLAKQGDDAFRDAVRVQAEQALDRAERALTLPADLVAVRRAATLPHAS